MESEQSKLTAEEVEAHLESELTDAYRFLDTGRKAVYDALELEAEIYANFDCRQKKTKYGRAQAEKVERLEGSFRGLMSGLGMLWEIIEEQTGIEMD